MEKNIYKMKLHETIMLNENSDVTRVPGGWIYGFGNTVGMCSVFVPYSNEFNAK